MGTPARLRSLISRYSVRSETCSRSANSLAVRCGCRCSRKTRASKRSNFRMVLLCWKTRETALSIAKIPDKKCQELPEESSMDLSQEHAEGMREIEGRKKGSVRTETTEAHQGSMECLLLPFSCYEVACSSTCKTPSRSRKARRRSESEIDAPIMPRGRK